MTAEELEQMDWICKRIQEEQDHKKLSELVRDLDALLARREQRFTSDQKPKVD